MGPGEEEQGPSQGFPGSSGSFRQLGSGHLHGDLSSGLSSTPMQFLYGLKSTFKCYFLL